MGLAMNYELVAHMLMSAEASVKHVLERSRQLQEIS